MKEESDLIRQTLYGKYEHAIFPYYVWQELFTLFDLSSEAPTRKVKIRDSLEMVDFNTKIEQLNIKKQKLIDVIGVNKF